MPIGKEDTMNKKIQQYLQEKNNLISNPRSSDNMTLMDKELFSIANAIICVYNELKKEEITPGDKKAYEWAVAEVEWALTYN